MSLELLVQNGVQFGHQSWRVCPKMMPYIWGEKNGVHLIDVSKTANRMEKASQFLEEVAARGEPILWVGTKKAAQPVIEQAAQKLESPYVSSRWIGGTLTNFSEVKKAIAKLKHYESLLEHSEKMYTKKEYGQFRKIVERVEDNVGGIRNISWPIGAVVVVDAKKEYVAVKEALKMGIPVVALTDTNTDPTGIDYVIPGNDDISRAIRVVLDPLVEAVQKGTQKAEQAAAQQHKAQEHHEQQQASQQEDQQEAQKQQEEAASDQQETQQSAQKSQKSTQSKQQTAKKSTSSQQESTTSSTASKTSTGQQTSTQQTKTSRTASKQSTTQKKSSSSAQRTSTTKQSSSQSTQSATKKSSTAEKQQSAATGDDEPVTPAGEEEQSNT